MRKILGRPPDSSSPMTTAQRGKPSPVQPCPTATFTTHTPLPPRQQTQRTFTFLTRRIWVFTPARPKVRVGPTSAAISPPAMISERTTTSHRAFTITTSNAGTESPGQPTRTSYTSAKLTSLSQRMAEIRGLRLAVLPMRVTRSRTTINTVSPSVPPMPISAFSATMAAFTALPTTQPPGRTQSHLSTRTWATPCSTKRHSTQRRPTTCWEAPKIMQLPLRPAI